MFSKLKVFLMVLLGAFSTICCVKTAQVFRPPTAESLNIEETSMIKNDFYSIAKLTVQYKDNSGHISATAFAVSDDLFMTAGHFCATAEMGANTGMLADEIEYTVLAPGGNTEVFGGVKVQSYSPSKDICLVRRASHGLQPVTFVFSSLVSDFEKVYVLGAPHDIFPFVTEGHITSHEPIVDGQNNYDLTLSAPANPGNSGSPIFNDRGKVIGMIIAVHPKYQQISLGVSSENLMKFLMHE